MLEYVMYIGSVFTVHEGGGSHFGFFVPMTNQVKIKVKY